MVVEAKFLIILGAVQSIGFLLAQQSPDNATSVLVLVGLFSGLITAAVGGYRAWRSERHKADVLDEPLMKTQFEQWRTRALVAEAQLERWEALFSANGSPLKPVQTVKPQAAQAQISQGQQGQPWTSSNDPG